MYGYKFGTRMKCKHNVSINDDVLLRDSNLLLSLIQIGITCLWFPNRIITVTPVSYTHLDVYKRQISNNVFKSFNTCILFRIKK